MPNILGPLVGGAAGAAGGFAKGGIPGAVLSGLAGLFGGGQQRMSAAQRHALQQQQQIVNNLMQYAQSTPLTNQQDLNALAQRLGVLGAQQRAQLGGLAAAGNILTPTGGTADMLANLQQAGTAARMSATEQHLADALAARRQALLSAAGINQQAFDMASKPGAIPASQFPAQMAALAEQYAKQQAMREAGKQAAAAAAARRQRDISSAESIADEGWRESLPTPSGQPGTAAGIPPMPLPPTATSGTENYAGPEEPPFLYQGSPAVGGGALPFGVSGPTLPGEGGAFGAGDAPQLDPMHMALLVLAHLVQHMSEQAKPRKRKTRGAGDAPSMPLPGYGAMAGPPMMQAQAMPGMQGAQARGNEPGGFNGVNNQMRQVASALTDRLRFGGSGLQFPL